MKSPASEGHRHSPADPSCLEVFERLSEYLDQIIDGAPVGAGEE